MGSEIVQAGKIPKWLYPVFVEIIYMGSMYVARKLNGYIRIN
jgi:hypothetical protein